MLEQDDESTEGQPADTVWVLAPTVPKIDPVVPLEVGLHRRTVLTEQVEEAGQPPSVSPIQAAYASNRPR